MLLTFLAVGTLSSADVGVLLLEGLGEELEGFFAVCSCVNGENEALRYRHFYI